MTEYTREQILEMEVGRELDALVAEKVMGFTISELSSEDVCWVNWTEEGYGDVHRRYKPSTDISAAWEVVEKLKTDYIVSIWTDDNGKYACEVDYIIHDDCETAPEAICKAALLAVMGL